MRPRTHLTSSADTYLAVSATYTSSYKYSPRVTFLQLAVPLSAECIHLYKHSKNIKYIYRYVQDVQMSNSI